MRKATVLLGICMTCALLVSGCSDGVRQHIREKDFRAGRTAQPLDLPPPSPIANVADMPGWTTDVDSAIAFAKDNGHKTVVFVQAGQSPQNRSMKNSLNGQQSALANVEKVTFDVNTSPEMAGRYGVTPPAVVILDSNGAAIAQQQGSVNTRSLAAAVR